MTVKPDGYVECRAVRNRHALSRADEMTVVPHGDRRAGLIASDAAWPTPNLLDRPRTRGLARRQRDFRLGSLS
jgi:hypothetical protein